MNRSPSAKLPDYILPAEGEPACDLCSDARSALLCIVRMPQAMGAAIGCTSEQIAELQREKGAANLVDSLIDKLRNMMPDGKSTSDLIAKRDQAILFVEGLLGTG